MPKGYKIREPREGKTDYSRRVAEAVKDEGWQKFRISLKGTSTTLKLSLLKGYYEEFRHTSRKEYTHTPAECYVCIRLDNYIKALARGGQLYAGESLQTMLACEWRPRIKRD